MIAVEDDDLLPPYTLTVTGWAPLEPGNCTRIYESKSSVYIPIPAYLGFAFFDASGRFTLAQVGEVPDLGQWVYASRYANLRWPRGKGPVLVTASKRLCVHQRPMSYELGSKSDVECSSFHPGGDASPYSPLAAQLFFHPAGMTCTGSPGPLRCYGGQYFLDVAPTPGNPNLRASAGTDPSDDTEPWNACYRPRSGGRNSSNSG